MRCTKSVEKQHVEMLRNEANEVKDCFTRYAFQGMTIATIAFGVIVEFQPGNPYVGLSGVVVSIFLLNISRIGLHKYATANRHFGYQLHLERTRHIQNSTLGGWRKKMRKIGWEEALRAWRIVQATCFDEVYRTPSNFEPRFFSRLASYGLKSRYTKRQRNGPLWFDIESLVADNHGRGDNAAIYYPGDYLRAQLLLIHLTCFLFLLPPFAALLQFWTFENTPQWFIWALYVVVPLYAVYLIFSVNKRNNRVKILEKQMLSIHSCAIMWQAVVLAHYLALRNLKNNPKSYGFDGYTRALREQALSLSSDLRNIHYWVINPNYRSPGLILTGRA